MNIEEQAKQYATDHWEDDNNPWPLLQKAFLAGYAARGEWLPYPENKPPYRIRFNVNDDNLIVKDAFLDFDDHWKLTDDEGTIIEKVVAYTPLPSLPSTPVK